MPKACPGQVLEFSGLGDLHSVHGPLGPDTLIVSLLATLPNMLTYMVKNDSCGVRTHALADWRLKPAP